MASNQFDVIVVGGGPAGTTAACRLAKDGVSVLLVDRCEFPRDKVCGDAISGKSLSVMRRLGILPAGEQPPGGPSWGILFGSPSGRIAALPFANRTRPIPPASVCRRTDFDARLLDAAATAGATIWTGTTAVGILREKGEIGVRLTGRGAVTHVSAEILIGADGANSVVARNLGLARMNPAHHGVGVRAYFKNVAGCHPDGFMEIHFVREALPGYFWIFPLGGGDANVGVGMLSRDVKKKRVRLKELLHRIVTSDRFAERFAGASQVGVAKGWGLPLGSRPRQMAGDRWMLAGDAARLIDPFTGEGIGNGMIAGEQAALRAAAALDAGDYTASFLETYEKLVLHKLGVELDVSRSLQRLTAWPHLIDFLIGRVGRNEDLALAFQAGFNDLEQRKHMASPSRLLWKLLRNA